MKTNTFNPTRSFELIRFAVEHAAEGFTPQAQACLKNAADHNDAAVKWAGRTWSTWARVYRAILKAAELPGVDLSPRDFLD